MDNIYEGPNLTPGIMTEIHSNKCKSPALKHEKKQTTKTNCMRIEREATNNR